MWARELVFVAEGPAPQALHFGSQLLCGQSPLFGGPARLRGLAWSEPSGGLPNQRGEACPSGLAVLSLRAMFAAVEYQNTLGRHAPTGERGQSRFDVWGKRRGSDVEAQLDGSGDLVHILPAGSRGAHEPLLNLALVRRKRAVDRSHGSCLERRTRTPVSCEVTGVRLLTSAQAGTTFSARGPFGP